MAFHKGYDLSDMNSPENKGLRFVFADIAPKLDLSPMTTRGITELHIVAVDKVLTAHENVKTVASTEGVTIDQLQAAMDVYTSAFTEGEFIHNALNMRHKYTVNELPSWGKWIAHLINAF